MKERLQKLRLEVLNMNKKCSCLSQKTAETRTRILTPQHSNGFPTGFCQELAICYGVFPVLRKVLFINNNNNNNSHNLTYNVSENKLVMGVGELVVEGVQFLFKSHPCPKRNLDIILTYTPSPPSAHIRKNTVMYSQAIENYSRQWKLKKEWFTLARKRLSVNCHFSVHLPKPSWRANMLCV